MKGAWVFVVGASGAGKDSVIASAQQFLDGRPDIVFSRRLVTRPVQSGSDHEPVTQACFLALQQAGGLHWHWQAHGFHYGIAQAYAEDVQAGRLVVVNGSRHHVSEMRGCAEVRVVEIAADPALLAERLWQRGRDSGRAVADRLARNARLTTVQADVVILNQAALAQAGKRLADYLSG